MGRAPCCSDHSGLKRGTWTADEDQKLVDYIQRHGCGNWRNLPKHAGLLRCWKSCRLRWVNYLRPDIKRGMFSSQEELLIIQLHAQLGNKWSSIATCLPGRTDNEIKNYWNTRLKKRLDEMGIDPLTHMPKQDYLLQRLMTPLIPSYMSQLVQYDMARVEAEALLRSRLNATVDSFISQICFDSAANHSVETDSTIQQLLLQRQDHQSSMNRCSAKCSPRHDHKIDCTRSIVQNSPSSSGTTPETAGFMIPNDRSLLQSDQIMKCHSNTEIPNSILPDDVDHNFFDSTSDERPTAEYNHPNALSPWPEDQPLAITDDQNAWECIPPIASRCSDIFSDAVRPITENIESSSSSTNSFERPFPISELLTGALDFITDPPCSAGPEASEFRSEEGNDYWRNMLLNSILGQSTN